MKTIITEEMRLRQRAIEYAKKYNVQLSNICYKNRKK